jgi:hypothetical protein
VRAGRDGGGRLRKCSSLSRDDDSSNHDVVMQTSEKFEYRRVSSVPTTLLIPTSVSGTVTA